MLRYSVLGLALLVDAPVLWSSFMTQTTTVEAALVRLLITIPIVGLLLGFVRAAGRTDHVERTVEDQSGASTARDS